MDRVFILAGRRRPSRAVMKEIADELGYPIDKIKEYFKYLVKKSRKARTTDDSFRHHHLSSSYSPGPEPTQHQPETTSSSPSLSPSPTLESEESPTLPSQSEADQASLASGSTTQDPFTAYEYQSYDDMVFQAMMDQFIYFPENSSETMK